MITSRSVLHRMKKRFRQTLWRKSKHCGENQNIVEKIKTLWRKSKHCGENQNIAEKIKTLWRKSKHCGENQNIVEKSKHCGENQKAHFVFSNFFPPEIRAIYEIMRKNTLRAGPATDNNMAACAVHAG
jgi:phosphoribosyl-AMP cyclohydrolase